MKKLVFSLIAVMLALSLFGCADIKAKEPLYVYGLGIDKNEAGMLLYVLADSKGVKFTQNPNVETNKEKSSGDEKTKKEASNDEVTPVFTLLTYGGKNVKNAFEAFFADYEDVYTGTTEIYLLGKNLSHNDIKELDVYLSDTPSLPLKRGKVICKDVYSDISKCAEYKDKEKLKKQFEDINNNILR